MVHVSPIAGQNVAAGSADLQRGEACDYRLLVKTPLWTEHAEKMKAVGGGDVWVTLEEVAEVMVALVEKDETGSVAGDLDQGEKIAIRGGSILEVSKVKVRDVQAFNDPSPSDKSGNTVSNMSQLEEEV